MNEKESYNDKVARLAWVESMIEYAYEKSLEFDNIQDLRIYLANKLMKNKNAKLMHLDVIIENPFVGTGLTDPRQRVGKYQEIL